jgi:hypothetical protein
MNGARQHDAGADGDRRRQRVGNRERCEPAKRPGKPPDDRADER